MFKIQFALLLMALSGLAQAGLSDARNLFDAGKSAEALEEVDAVLDKTPTDPEARFLKGIVLADLKRSDEAIEVFAGLTRDYPELPEPYNNLAVLFAERGDYDKARESLLAAIQTHPSYSTAHENLGDLYAKMAGRAYDRALTENRANESARLKLSAVNALFNAPRAAGRPGESEPDPVVVAQTPAPAPTPVPKPKPSPPATSTAPPPVAAVTPRPADDDDEQPPDTGEVADFVAGWADAWASQNVNGYLAHYGDNFRPAQGLARETWVSQRRDRLQTPEYIRVELENMRVRMRGADRARVDFIQNYDASNYKDRSRKTLELQRTSDGWRIVSEQSRPL